MSEDTGLNSPNPCTSTANTSEADISTEEVKEVKDDYVRDDYDPIAYKLVEDLKTRSNKARIKNQQNEQKTQYRLYDVTIDGVKTRAYIRPRKATPRTMDAMIGISKALAGQHFLMYLVPISEEEYLSTLRGFRGKDYDKFLSKSAYKKTSRPTKDYIRVTKATQYDIHPQAKFEDIDLDNLPEFDEEGNILDMENIELQTKELERSMGNE